MKKLFTILFLIFIAFSGKSQNCVASFYPYVISGSDTVNFYDYSYNNDSTQINVISWQWSFGDNTFASTQNPLHVYSGPGTYYVCLTITTSSSCTSTYCDSVVVTGSSSGCAAYFSYYPDSACSTCYYFNDLSTGSGLSYYWSFGDSTFSSSQYPYHQYNTTGTYLVCLTISNSSGCSDTYCDSVYIGVSPPNCHAAFYATPDTTTSSLSYNFYDFSTGNPISWSWNFGDGSFSTLQNPSHTYQSAGTYYVCLTIATSSSCTSTYCDSVVVTGSSSGCAAYFSYYPDSACSTCYYFNDLSTGSGLSYYWSFGDSTFSSSQYPYHQYNTTGTYLVCLTISNSSGCSDTYCDSVYIGVSPPNCHAAFYAVPDSGTNYLNYSFYDYSYGNPVSWLWSFGDGTSSTLQNPVHTYQLAGTYTVCLTISTLNCTDSLCYVLAIAPTSNCLLYVSYTTVPESYSSANNGSIDVTVNFGTAPFSYLWSNGATTQDLNNISEGYYNVFVTDSSGCSSYASIYVADSSYVYIPIGTLSNLPVDTCLQFNYDTVYVYNLDVIDSTTISVTWIFLEYSSGTTAYLVDTFIITSQGYYSVSITISCNQKKSIDTYTGHVYVDYDDISLSIDRNKITESYMELFPNPFNEILNLHFDAAAGNQIKLILYDITGKNIFERNYNVDKGSNNIIINTDMLGHGMYFVNIISGNQIFNKKIVK